jgi:purine-binding chemotaxis protein CheW
MCRVGSLVCGLQLDQVTEMMRPLPIDFLEDAPTFMLGVSIIRGEPVPVLDAGRLLGAEKTTMTRLVCLSVGARRVALGVGEVLGIQEVPHDTLRNLPPLLDKVSGDTIAVLGVLDGDLLVVLEGARLISDSAWDVFDKASLS